MFGIKKKGAEIKQPVYVVLVPVDELSDTEQR